MPIPARGLMKKNSKKPKFEKAQVRKSPSSKKPNPAAKSSTSRTDFKKKHTTPAQKDQGLSETAKNIAVGARELFEKADRLDQEADALHMSAHEVHTMASHLPLKSDVGLDGPEIVIDEKRLRKSKPFPIVGIGASAGGYEAFAEFLHSLPTDTGM